MEQRIDGVNSAEYVQKYFLLQPVNWVAAVTLHVLSEPPLKVDQKLLHAKCLSLSKAYVSFAELDGGIKKKNFEIQSELEPGS